MAGQVESKGPPIPVVQTLDEISSPGRGRRDYLPSLDVPISNMPESTKALLRKGSIGLPDTPEIQVGRHYTALADLNLGVLDGDNELGSCTVKYNPVIHEEIVAMSGFAWTSPRQLEDQLQGNLRVSVRLKEFLTEITGMDDGTLNPLAGAHGEFTSILIIKAFHQKNGEGKGRRKILVPDSAHGSNAASAAMGRYEVVPVSTNARGTTDLKHFRSLLGGDVAGTMITNPNTHGLFEDDILEMAYLLHNHGGLLYGDGANLNAIMGLVKPGDLGFDLLHLNLHKSFSGPHGGGGPGSGPVIVKKPLRSFLPFPAIEQVGDQFRTFRPENSIGRISDHFGSFDVILRAYAYIRSNGAEGLRRVSEDAVLNANYLRVKLQRAYQIAYDRACMHEVVFSDAIQKAQGVSADSIARRLADFKFHPPTIYFPLTVQGALMIEPTETSGDLDKFVDAMLQIADEAKNNPDIVNHAPHTTRVSHLDDATPARELMKAMRSAS